jgi:DUF971 family protein
VSHADPERPTEIDLDLAANELGVTWADGHRSRYGGAWLRRICPCATCRGHVPGEVPPPSWEQVKDVRVLHAEGVGTYAIRFSLSDGHTTGIYSYDWLRANCPSTRDDLDEVGRPLAGEA